MVRGKNIILFNTEIKYMELRHRGVKDGDNAMSLGWIRSLNHFVLSDCVLWLGRRQNTRLSRFDSCFRSQDVFFEEAQADDLFQIFPGASTVDSLVPLTIVVRAVFFYSEEFGIVLDQFRTSDSWFILNDVEHLIDGEPQRSEVLCWIFGEGTTSSVMLFDVVSLRVTVCFFRAIATMKEAFEESFGLDEKETLSMDLDFNKSTILLQIKIGSPQTDPPKAKFRRSPGILRVRAHRKRHVQIRSTGLVPA